MKILDACCGSRMFWFDKENEHVTFMDIRKEKIEIHGKKVNVDPDVIGDFRDMPFDDGSFHLVVFDPPHLKWAGPNSVMKAQYGQLDKVTWKEGLVKGFAECMRVLKPNGTLIFKWSDCQINVREILNAIPFKPLFGQQRGTTHWMAFAKIGKEEYRLSGRVKMNRRQRKKKILKGLNKEERYRRTHCPVCDDKIGVFEQYFNSYGFCSEYCGYEYYGISRL